MRTEFNNLHLAIMKTNYGQEVVIAMENLEAKITEIEKRLECARRSNQESNSIVMSLVGSFQDQGKTEEVLTYGDFETLQRGVYDVDIALNFNDKEPIDNNWYGLFEEPKKEEPIDNEPYLTLCSSWGSITCNEKGDIVEVVGDEYINGERNYLHDIESIDVAEYLKFLKDNNIEFYDDADILAVGFRKKNGEYDRADKKWRDEMYLGITEEEEEEEEEVKNEPPTELCKTPQTHEFVKDIIAKLKVIDVDGETMQYIIEQVGMTDQMLRQLIMSNPESDTKDLLEEKIMLSN